MKTRRKYKKRRKRRKNNTRKRSGGGDNKYIFRIAALAYVGYSWDLIKEILDGYNKETEENEWELQLVNLSTREFNELLSAPTTTGELIQEGEKSYDDWRNDTLEQLEYIDAKRIYNKWRKEDRKKKKDGEKKSVLTDFSTGEKPSINWNQVMWKKEDKKDVMRKENEENIRKHIERIRKNRKELETKKEAEWHDYNERKKMNDTIQQQIAENKEKYTTAKLDDAVYCINCGQPFHKGCVNAVREVREERDGEIIITYNDKCPTCRQDLFKIETYQKADKWFENIYKWGTKVLKNPAKEKHDEEGCPICLLSWDECDLNVGRWGDDIIVEPRSRRWLRNWRQRAMNTRQRLRNTTCAVMGGRRKKKKKRKRKTRKKKRKRKTRMR